MKKSINNLSFDEIFAERGERINGTEMVKGEIYLNTGSNNEISNILRFYEFDKPNHIVSSETLFESGNFYFETSAHSVMYKYSLFYTATKNQIALLNSYISES